MIEIQDLCLGFESGRWTLNDLSLSVHQGEKVVLIGKSGSGKTTLLQAIFGFLPPFHQGRLMVLGGEVASTKGKHLRGRVGILFQNPEDQFICATVEEELRFAPENLGASLDEVEERIARLSESLHLKDLLPRAPLTLSWGEKKRVALASVLSASPELMLLDDPFSGLCAEEQKTICACLDDSLSTILVTCPDFSLTNRFGTHEGLLEGGRMIRYGVRQD